MRSPLAKTHRLVPGVLRQLSAGPRRSPRDAAPASLADLPSYALLIDPGVCAVVLSIMFRRVPGRGAVRP